MTVGFIYDLCLYSVAKNKQQGLLSPDDFNNVINIGQLGYLDYLFGEPQQYQNGRPIPRVQWGMNAQVRLSLTALIQRLVPLTIDGTGLSPYPTDFQQVDALMTTSMKRIRFVPQNKTDSFVNSTIDAVATNPVYSIVDEGFQFYPISLGSALLSYVKTPPDIKWAYTFDSNGLPAQDIPNSKDPVFYDVDCMQIIVRALAIVGVNLQFAQVEQYSNQIKNQGQ